ncbi:GntR family transcriptional regulator [Pseudoroseomonas rhizosphaerae]|uniref:GntR family transcriptional regulator n=1 Tax=Teichococcus rhizosphaerae TaxID=1335062 RepID=A0A2C7AJ75_9PROT|nr:GntR family transcriptional regulator [Pseudoroseomonas rhizosphaerae]PHK96817.1 GntR family transcriptional regulator [Pseudoroseomonas rhizosphaerae]
MADSPVSPLHIVRTQSLASLVADELERMILSGEIPPGTRLNEQALAARLGVSRGPVREAVRGLDRSGLVVTVVNQGSFVRQLSAEEAMDVYDLRVALTGYACERLAGRATPEQLGTLEDMVQGMESAADSDDAARYYALNLDFHSALMSMGGSSRAVRLYDDLGKELTLFRRRALVAPENMRESNAEHAAILHALAAGDAAAARMAGEAHIRGGKRRFATSTPPAGTEPAGKKRPGKAAARGEEEHVQDRDAPGEPTR